MGDLVASRTLNELYIYLDIAFLVILGAFLWITQTAGGLLVWHCRRTAVLCRGLRYFLSGTAHPHRYRRKYRAVSFMAQYELWFYQLRVDLADAQSGQAPGRMVGTDCLRLDLFCDDEQ